MFADVIATSVSQSFLDRNLSHRVPGELYKLVKRSLRNPLYVAVPGMVREVIIG